MKGNDEYRSGPDPRPLAERWHIEHCSNDESWSPCYCCCTRCDPDYGGGNPHFFAALDCWEDA